MPSSSCRRHESCLRSLDTQKGHGTSFTNSTTTTLTTKVIHSDRQCLRVFQLHKRTHATQGQCCQSYQQHRFGGSSCSALTSPLQMRGAGAGRFARPWIVRRSLNSNVPRRACRVCSLRHYRTMCRQVQLHRRCDETSKYFFCSQQESSCCCFPLRYCCCCCYCANRLRSDLVYLHVIKKAISSRQTFESIIMDNAKKHLQVLRAKLDKYPILQQAEVSQSMSRVPLRNNIQFLFDICVVFLYQ